MSLLDHTFDDLPKRADADRHAMRGGKTWFSRDTIRHARHFDDVSWVRMCLPAVTGLALIAAASLVLTGEIAALSNLVGAIVLMVGLSGLLSKAWSMLTGE